MRLGDRPDIVEAANPGRDRDHALDARLERPRDEALAVVGEIRKVQMAVAVDKHGHAQAVPVSWST